MSELKPLRLIKKNHFLRKEDIKKSLQGINDFISVNCPACKNEENNFLFLKEGYKFLSCKKCRTMYVSPRPTRKQLLDFYYKAKFIKHWNEVLFFQTSKSRKKLIYNPMIKKIKNWCIKFNISFNKLVDMGSGIGLFCESVKEEKIFEEIFGVDFSNEYNRENVTFIRKTVEDITPQDVNQVSVITCFELIEHLFNPDLFFKVCKDIMIKKGLLFLSTPNIQGFDLSVLGSLSDNIIAPIHLNYFNPKSISLLLKRNRFKVIEISTPGKLDVKNVLEKKDKILGFPFIEQISDKNISFKFQKFLSENKLSSHMIVVAQC